MREANKAACRSTSRVFSFPVNIPLKGVCELGFDTSTFVGEIEIRVKQALLRNGFDTIDSGTSKDTSGSSQKYVTTFYFALPPEVPQK